MKEFAKGIKVEGISTKYGDIIKLGINKEKFLENDFKDGWLNLELKKSKEQKWYQEINTYKKEG